MSGGQSLTVRERRIVRAVCETLIPPIEREDDSDEFFATGAGAATAERVERMIGAIRDPRDVGRLRQLLWALSVAPLNLLMSGRWGALDALGSEAREHVLRRWAHSRLPIRRAGFQALKRLTQVAFYAWPFEADGHPAWRHVGRVGPLPQPDEGVPPLATFAVEGDDTVLECDVVVVGSGAGGGVAAGVLAEVGRDVVVLERGPNPGARDMTQIEGDMLQSLYLDGGLLMTQSGSMPILAGSCVGGGTTINYTTSFPLPESVQREWGRVSGLDLFTSER
ncbi:MAG: GMC family oxidoreductase N-terminal domain-containing protein, partial [Gemmatimonadales bacterium]